MRGPGIHSHPAVFEILNKVPFGGSFQDIVRGLPVGQSVQAGPSSSCARVGSLLQVCPVGSSRIRVPQLHFDCSIGFRKSETFCHFLFAAICNFTFYVYVLKL